MTYTGRINRRNLDGHSKISEEIFKINILYTQVGTEIFQREVHNKYFMRRGSRKLSQIFDVKN
jgi:hypothetical protein